MKNSLVEIITNLSGTSSVVVLVWVVLTKMKGLPSIVMQWVLVGYAIVGLCILIKNFILV